MKDGSPNNINLILDLPVDPTELVIKNKEFLSDLKKCGFDGREIGKILKNYYGLRLSAFGKKADKNKKGWVEFCDIMGEPLEDEPWPDQGKLKKYKTEYEMFSKGIDNAIRSAKGVLKQQYISYDTKKLLEKDIEHLSKTKRMYSYNSYNGRLLHPDEADLKRKAISLTQMTGFQVVAAVNYINLFMEKTKKACWKEVDIFSLICEIFNKTVFESYSIKDIKNLYYNNLKHKSDSA